MGYSNIVGQSRGGVTQTATGPAARQFSFMDPGRIADWYKNQVKQNKPKEQPMGGQFASAPKTPPANTSGAAGGDGMPLNEYQARMHGLLPPNPQFLGPLNAQMIPNMQSGAATGFNMGDMERYTAASKHFTPNLAGKLGNYGGGGASHPADNAGGQALNAQAGLVGGQAFGADYQPPGSYRPGYFEESERYYNQSNQNSEAAQAAALAAMFWGA